MRALIWLGALAWASAVGAQVRAVDGLAALDAGDAAQARAIWTPLAARGDVLAQHNLGVLYLTGQGGARDLARAQGLLAAAAAQGHGPAQQAMADLAVEAGDWALAAQWYGMLAETDAPAAQFTLAQVKDQGLRDPEAALRWYRAAADQGMAEAQFSLGALLAEAGAEAKAATWFEAAAAQGHVLAQHNLAVALAEGVGRAQDMEAARGWYLRAARAGHAPSMHNLALMQARGQGGAQQVRHALAWALNAQSADLSAALRDVMTQDAIRAAEALAPDCLQGRAACD